MFYPIYMYFDPYMYGLILYVYTYIWAAHIAIYVRDRGIKLYFIRNLNCSWIKEHLYQRKLPRFLSPCTI